MQVESNMTYKQALGERLGAKHLPGAGFSDIVSLNAIRRNERGGDILAQRDGRTYLFSVKARDRFGKDRKPNRGYNLYPEKVRAAADRYGAVPAWLTVRADRRDNTYSVFWGTVHEDHPLQVKMSDAAVANYDCLARDVPCAEIVAVFKGKDY